ncbi:MAG: hypothetical protein H6819_08530 [Phycisphaerales bacterium]|nr:hypothetical protein [Phycisphaerales bacterium]MCB9854148.1 hypothetical protein [Phycisphaerales bacterium]MCB9864716.1 hypothetical protein [Phycisphaerales bacterium]
MTKLRITLTIVLMAMGLSLAATSGCDDYYAWPGDFLTPNVEPMDFSPYGYDYDMYDLFTEDL